MRATARLKDNQTGILLRHERKELLSRELFTELRLPSLQGSMHLKNSLCQIGPNHHIFHVAVLSIEWL
ncbi:hypothetical protein [Leisingera sp. HS039]|uniref:hypothetical protein n=1 Tax=Leisingera sp. HS039 TaxID=2818496 RepID=UPI001B39EF5D|nr:hypothetical protein [Leisingera sp. HS039]